MRREINSWKSSNKYAEFKAKLEARKEEILNLKIEFMGRLNDDDEYIDREELKQYAVAIIQSFDYIDDEDFFDVDVFSVIGKEKDILFEYIQRQYPWFNYLIDYLLDEDYELCTLIRDVIKINEKTLIHNINKYGVIMEDKESFFEEIKDVNIRLFNSINKGI